MAQPMQVHHHHYYGPVTQAAPAPTAPGKSDIERLFLKIEVLNRLVASMKSSLDFLVEKEFAKSEKPLKVLPDEEISDEERETLEDPAKSVEEYNELVELVDDEERELQERRLLATSSGEHTAISKEKCEKYSAKMGDTGFTFEEAVKDCKYDEDDEELYVENS